MWIPFPDWTDSHLVPRREATQRTIVSGSTNECIDRIMITSCAHKLQAFKE
ncbi:hypothetical protein RO3G_06054 [Rhizopus delemar RA 99-880]|uniref:Uncharacterized protein n=1 Tax=Rhizopus delemar (strain RA 99-880 / ATCC MYA-4621 / FGSC 9543 / NRRL 43880) TaxID=246409 RepID=I1BYR9_RHIO9|nr:hypothetical protein RO3G_06054 [Rhizopus delemar RA 99-880]|eukprot:EIE81349.1 hypothetical protein RO3G_06054 [Rhizopus delemar RA 99-880]